MNIGVDIYGGDFAPDAVLDGVVLALEVLDKDDRLFLFGNEEYIRKYFANRSVDAGVFEIVNCSETFAMGDDPVKTFREKKDSGIVKGFFYLKQGIIDGFASAGNTGAMMVGATQVIGVLEGIIRPCLSSICPNNKGGNNLILDVGLNADPKPEVLAQYAQIGSAYAKYVMGIDNPRIGLLNIGSEEGKGNLTAKATYKLLKELDNINFIGNIEGGDCSDTEKVDVIVTDGFVGNIYLKHAESIYSILKQRGINDPFFDNYNYENVGGTPALGVNGTVIIGHGKSNGKAIKNMILQTKAVAAAKLHEKIASIIK
ncbi:MAG: phosphate acyltransferase [Bacteroidales bacterium]|nr:phosphate acyltransferase [Bacteroidales bacterium]MBQ1652841.1 phosphate acyltransferase [Bacteroidales bacterium]MBQ1695116.1 phosphate acyltransferase [Bacteroidales bacterium]MBQ1719927.1 phosphate acyltransferase [Bacteroidales bacterium]MBQ1732244.1 phosphate acyltransferase [Bacteroidales bacterium]